MMEAKAREESVYKGWEDGADLVMPPSGLLEVAYLQNHERRGGRGEKRGRMEEDGSKL